MCQCRYCPECKNDSTEVIAAGEKLRFSKKKSNMMSKKSECNRDWGKVGTIIITQCAVFVGTCCDIDSSQVSKVVAKGGGWNFSLPEIFKLTMVILSQIAPEAI